MCIMSEYGDGWKGFLVCLASYKLLSGSVYFGVFVTFCFNHAEL